MNTILAALILGFIFDLIVGDPSWLYHPVCLIGNLIAFLEKKLRALFPKNEKGELWGGCLEVLLVCLIVLTVPFLIRKVLYHYCPAAGFLLETIWCSQLFASKSLKTESMKVYDRLKNGTIEEARYAVSMIVGRDTKSLTETGVTKAAVETIAESTSDGIIAPMFYMALGGVPLMFLYKGINTMDSMLGYKNDKYLYFGRCAAKLDDVANFIPARIAGILMVAASFACSLIWHEKKTGASVGDKTGGFDGRHAWKIFWRDRRNHASPNSAHTESAMAGALRVQLAGDAWYFGKLYKKPFIGENDRPIEAEDIVRANHLMYMTAVLGAMLCAAVMILL